MIPRWGITYLINLSPRIFITYVFPRSFPGLSPLLIIIMKSKSVGCHFIMIYYVFVIIITCILIDCFIRMNNFAELSIGCVLIIIIIKLLL